MIWLRIPLGVVIVLGLMVISSNLLANNNQVVALTSLVQLRTSYGVQDPVKLCAFLRDGNVGDQVIGADPNRKIHGVMGDQFTSLLHIAVLAGNLMSVETLLARGADVRATDYEGRTPIGVGLEQLNKENKNNFWIRLLFPSTTGSIVRLLLQRGGEHTMREANSYIEPLSDPKAKKQLEQFVHSAPRTGRSVWKLFGFS
jgi:hypothetical protein